jgi:hypothetical protein
MPEGGSAMNEGPVDEPVAVRRGPHLLICRRDESTVDAGWFGWPPVQLGQLFVLVTAGAGRAPSFAAALPVLLRPYLKATGSRLLRIALPGLGGHPTLPQRLAEEFGLEVAVPDGAFVARPGAAMYAGHGTGGTGWRLFRPGAAAGAEGVRYPRPRWESAMPSSPVAVGALVADPVPAGLLVRDARARAVRMGDLAAAVAVDHDVLEVVVGGHGPVPGPAAVAEVLGRIPFDAVRLIPAEPAVAAYSWLVELALRLGRDLVVSTGVRLGGVDARTFVPGPAGQEPLRPFPTVLRQSGNGGDQEVLEAAPPPPGWERSGTCAYRLGEVLADVVPSGLVLRTGAADPAGTALPFDPGGWTLRLGTPGEVVGPALLAAAQGLLDGLDPGQRALVRLRVIGILDDRTKSSLGPGAARPSEPAAAVAPPSARPPRTSPIVTTSGAPVSTFSSAPAVRSAPAPELVPVHEIPDPADEVQDDPPAVPDELDEPVVDEDLEVVVETEESLPGSPDSKPLLVADRPSTSSEQTRFTTAASASFGEALATVNAALATWPAMRQGGAAGVKADYVAVCLFLGSGEGGALSLNRAVRAGLDAPVAGQLPCLSSGIRRLPTHRRAVLRQGRASEPPEPGVLLTEPGFLTASSDLDVTVPGADLDVLIWPVSARRTSELAVGRPVDEVVFLAGARFKALAVRTAEDDDTPREYDGPAPPRAAVLFRELAPGESPSESGELDERDLAVLNKLDRILVHRQKAQLRLVDDEDSVTRLTASLVEWQEETAVPAPPTRPAVMAS